MAYLWGYRRAPLLVWSELMHALASPQCAFALITQGIWQRHSGSNREIKGCVCLKEVQLCGRSNVSVQYFPYLRNVSLAAVVASLSHTNTHSSAQANIWTCVWFFFFLFLVFPLSGCWLLSCFYSLFLSTATWSRMKPWILMLLTSEAFVIM